MIRKTLLVGLTALIAGSAQVSAEVTDFLFSNRFFGTVSTGLGVYFLVEANKARSDGNDAYALYEAAGSSTLARELYEESRQKDTKAAIMLGLGLGTITYGIHLWLKDPGDLPEPEMDRGLVEVKGVKIDAGTDQAGRVGVLLRRKF